MSRILIKQKKGSLDRIVSSSFFALLIVGSVYVYQNMTLVYSTIEYRRSACDIARLEEDILQVSNQLALYKKSLGLSNVPGELRKVSSSDFVVRSSVDTDVVVLYEAR